MKKIISCFLNSIFSLFKINNKKIIFQTGRGMIDGNPKAIYDYMKENNKDYKLIWLVTKDTNTSKLDEKHYTNHSLMGLYHLATAKYWIRSESLGSILKKRKEQVYIQTWHGYGTMKKMGYDVNNAKERPPLDHVKEWDYLITNDQVSEDIMLSSTGYNKELAQIGTPRTDSILKNVQDDKFIKNLKKELHIPKNKKVILYAPTFRDEQLDMENVDLKIDALSNLKDYIILTRVHPLIRHKINKTNNKNFIDVSLYPDVNELLVITDILITDYCSIVFEYALLERPMIFYGYDYQEYLNTRGLYNEYPEDFPGDMVDTDEQLVEIINNIEKYKRKTSKQIKEMNKKYNLLNNGQVCKKFVEMLEEGYFNKK